MDYGNLSNWKSVILYPTAPYLTDEGFLNPKCSEKAERMSTNTNTYVIGADEGCLSEDAKTLCNGPLKPKAYYVWETYAHTTNLCYKYFNPGVFLTCFFTVYFCVVGSNFGQQTSVGSTRTLSTPIGSEPQVWTQVAHKHCYSINALRPAVMSRSHFPSFPLRFYTFFPYFYF